MGKQKRARQKYHLACVNGRIELDDSKSTSGRSVSSWKSVNSKIWKVIPDNNLFQNINIDINSLNKLETVEEDRKSVKSLSKTIKRSVLEAQTNIKLTKDVKRSLRKQFFIQKVEAVHRVLEMNRKKKKGAQDNGDLSSNTLKNLPEGNMLFYKSQTKTKGDRPVSIKSRPILKAKKRKEALINDVETFKKMMIDPNISCNTLDNISGIVLNKIMNEEI